MFRDKYADLCDQLSAAEIVSQLYSARYITMHMMEQVDAASTQLQKNKCLLRYLQRWRHPVTEICEVLDKFEAFKYIAESLRAGQL